MSRRLPVGACPVCDRPLRAAFNWRLAQRPDAAGLGALAAALAPSRPLRCGVLYACRDCGQPWYLDADGAAMNRVAPAREALLAAWDAQPLPVAPDHLSALSAIGATHPRYWLGGQGVLAIPCAVTLTGGERLDPALVWLTRRPPLDAFPACVRLWQGVAAVEPTRYALPFDVRQATVSAPEVRMGWAPTRVEAPDGRAYALDWATALFGQDGLVGDQLRLSRRRLRPDETLPAGRFDGDWATCLLADWPPGVEQLTPPRRGWWR